MIELRLRTILLLAALGLITLIGMPLAQRYAVFSQQPRPARVITDTTGLPPAAEQAPGPSLTLANSTAAWHLRLVDPPERVQAALARRYPDLAHTFPQGVLLTLLDAPVAPEPLRGAYDDQPGALRLGAVYPPPQPGEALQPEAEAWAGCRRLLEVGPDAQLRCYLTVRGEPGPILDGLAVLAWLQAMDVAMSGRVQPLDPATLPLLTPDPQGTPWTFTAASLSLSSSPSSSSLPFPP